MERGKRRKSRVEKAEQERGKEIKQKVDQRLIDGRSRKIKKIKNYFSDGELACSHCGFLNFRKSTLYKLNLARAIAKIPFSLNSACRCPIHNKDVKGEPDSSHIATETIETKGVDIKAITSQKRYKIVKALLEVGFCRIFIYEKHLHVDDDETKPQNVMGLKIYS